MRRGPSFPRPRARYAISPMGLRRGHVTISARNVRISVARLDATKFDLAEPIIRRLEFGPGFAASNTDGYINNRLSPKLIDDYCGKIVKSPFPTAIFVRHAIPCRRPTRIAGIKYRSSRVANPFDRRYVQPLNPRPDSLFGFTSGFGMSASLACRIRCHFPALAQNIAATRQLMIVTNMMATWR